MSSSNLNEAWQRFYQEYGRAMVAWQVLESELSTLFSILTKIPPAMAVQLYYSSRSFQGRIDVLKGGLVAADATTDVKSLANIVIRKAKKYAEYRNKFAHDQPLQRQIGPSPDGSPAMFDIVLVDGKGQFQRDEVKRQYLDAGVEVDEVTDAAKCFSQLSEIVRDFWAHYRSQPQHQDAWLDTLRVRLDALPNLPRPKGQSQPSSKPKPPRPPSRG
jgi:hypothetical protein